MDTSQTYTVKQKRMQSNIDIFYMKVIFLLRVLLFSCFIAGLIVLLTNERSNEVKIPNRLQKYQK